MAIETPGAPLRQIARLFAGGTVAGLPDAQLLDRFAADGDAAAFEVLVARYGPMVLSVCRGVLRDPNDAEDAFQATFLILVKKAGTFRGRAALGGWLYRVAHRVALRANTTAALRRAHERRAGQMSTATSVSGPKARDELLRAVHEEIGRLPERFRAAIVLCDLRGVPQELAAEELGLSERTLRRRLSGARGRLRARLGSRGPEPDGATLSALFLREARADLPTAWGEATVRAALAALNHSTTAGTISAAATELTREVSRAMMLQKLGIVAATLLGAGLLAWGASAALVMSGEDPPPGKAPTPARAERPIAGPAAAKPGPGTRAAAVPVGGRVVDPAGRPVAGATLYVAYSSNRTALPPPTARATTDREGGYRFELARSELDETVARDAARSAQVVAVSPGFAPAWMDLGEVERLGGATELRLAVDDAPIRGRILDLEGRPVAGATVRVQNVWGSPGGTLRCRPPGYPERLITDAEGRFRVDGIGRERTVGLALEGPTIPHQSIQVTTRDVPTVVGPRPTIRGGKQRTLYGATFDLVVRPGRTLAGVVRDRDTGLPMPGLIVRSADSDAKATTDAQGRYELPGFPKATEYALYVRPAEQGHPYFNAKFTFPDAPGLTPLRADINVLRGIPLRIRVVDGPTKAAVPGAVIYYVPLFPNPHVRPEYAFGLLNPVYPQADGTTLGVAWPGPGAICVRAAEDMRSLAGRYAPARIDPRPFFGAGAADTRDRFGDLDQLTVAFHGRQQLTQGQFHAIDLIDPAVGTESITRVIALEPGRTLTVEILGADGEALTGARVQQRAGDRWDPPLKVARFELTGLNPARPRTVVVEHEPRRLIGRLVARGDEPGPATVRLRPWAAIAGRLVDRDGKPRAGVRLQTAGQGLGDPPAGHVLPIVRTDSQGRFLIEELIEGMTYHVKIIGLIDGAYDFIEGTAAEGLTVRSGEREELGDIRAGSGRPAE